MVSVLRDIRRPYGNKARIVLDVISIQCISDQHGDLASTP
jgi:hypothetical protein